MSAKPKPSAVSDTHGIIPAKLHSAVITRSAAATGAIYTLALFAALHLGKQALNAFISQDVTQLTLVTLLGLNQIWPEIPNNEQTLAISVVTVLATWYGFSWLQSQKEHKE